MHPDNNILYHVAPALLLLIIVESVYMMKEHRHDNKNMMVGIGLGLGAIPISFLTKGMILCAYTFIYQIRLFTMPSNSWWVWVLCFFLYDFSYYWYHRLSHQIRFLWASHIVHHSSEKFTLSAGLRVPWTSNVTGIFLFWAWIPLLGIEPYVIIFMKSMGLLYQFFLHTETIVKLPKWFEAIFNTPSHHRVHHASDVDCLDKNHAGTLIIWDKLFGTFQEETHKSKYGLTGDIKSFNPIIIEFHEWRRLLNDLKKAKSFKNQVHYLFDSPGWSPDGNSKTTKQLQSELSTNK